MNSNRSGADFVFASALLVSAFLVANSPAKAQEAVPLEERVQLCMICHGEDGVPIETTVPIIAGQEFYYIYVQLKDFKAGRRANEIMGDIVKDMSRKEMKALADYFSKKDWPKIRSGADSATAQSGETGLAAGQCSQCHSTYSGDSRVPRVAGQQLDYLERTMLEFKNKLRLNSPAKGSLLSSFDDKDITAMAHNLADR